MAKPTTTVEVAFNAGWTGTPTWTDVTSYVRHVNGIDIDKWRAEEFSQCQPSRCSLTLNNADGRFTPGLATGAYYPNVKKGRRIRVRSTVAGVTTTRFLGYVNDWSVDWPGVVTSFATCAVTATSRMARLGAEGELRSVIEEEILLDTPAAYYTMGEPAGATSAADSSINSVESLVRTGPGTAVVFGNATGPGTDGLTAATFNGQYLSADMVDPMGSTGASYIECFFNASSAPADAIRLAYARLSSSPAGVQSLEIQLTNIGTVDAFGQTSFILSSGSNMCDGSTHHAALVYSGTTVELFIDGVSVGTSAVAAGQATGYTFMAAGQPVLGPPGTAIVIAHVATGSVMSGSRIAAHSAAGLTGFAGEATGDRIERYASYAGVPLADISAETGDLPGLAHIDTTGKTSLECMREVEAAESGVLFDASDGTLKFQDRSHRYAAASAFTLDLASGAVTAPLAPVLDDQQMVNDMTATGSTGISGTVVDTSSVADYGSYRQTLDVATSNPDEPLLAAAWRVNRYAEPEVRIPSVEVHLNKADPVLTAAVLAAEVGTKFTLSGLPANAPASTMVLFVEGMAEHIDNDEHKVILRTSAADLFDVWILDSATYSVLGSTTVPAY